MKLERVTDNPKLIKTINVIRTKSNNKPSFYETVFPREDDKMSGQIK